MMERRDRDIHFVMSDKEIQKMDQKMRDIGVKNKSAYLRKMALDGYCIKLETNDIKEMIRLLRIAGNNLNQFAIRAHESNNVYMGDIDYLQKRFDEIWMQAKEITERLSTIE